MKTWIAAMKYIFFQRFVTSISALFEKWEENKKRTKFKMIFATSFLGDGVVTKCSAASSFTFPPIKKSREMEGVKM